MHFQCEDGTYEHESVGAWMLLKGIEINIEVWNKLYRMEFLRKYDIHAIHHIMEDVWLSHTMWLYAKKITMVSAIMLCYNIRESSVMTSTLDMKRTNKNLVDLCDVIVSFRELIESKFQNVQGAYDLYYDTFMRSIMYLVALYSNEEQICYIKSHLKNAARKVPSIRCLHSSRYRFIYLCSCFYDNGYSYYHYDALYTKLQKFLPQLFKE